MNQAVKLLFTMIGAANHTDNPSKLFAVEPTRAQKMNAQTRLSSDFLQRINVRTVINQAGQAIGIGADLIAGNTDTSGNVRRHPKKRHVANAIDYLCRKVNFDTCIEYSDLDAWAQVPEYQTLVNQQLEKSKALSLICIGFNGKEYQANTDFSANPLLQDCQIGWLWKLRKTHPLQVAGWATGAIGTTAANIKYGPAQHYKNLDALVADHVSVKIAEQFQSRPDLVVVCNKRTLDDKYFYLINDAGTKATETAAAGDICISTKRIGGLTAITVPYFPENAVLITPLANLSIYLHQNGKRRKVIDEPEYDRIAHYESDNIDFVIEEPASCVLIDNIEAVA